MLPLLIHLRSSFAHYCCLAPRASFQLETGRRIGEIQPRRLLGPKISPRFLLLREIYLLRIRVPTLYRHPNQRI